jgi:hypothetical protein
MVNEGKSISVTLRAIHICLIYLSVEEIELWQVAFFGSDICSSTSLKQMSVYIEMQTGVLNFLNRSCSQSVNQLSNIVRRTVQCARVSV